MRIRWENVEEFESKSYICGFCGSTVSSNKGYHGSTTISMRMRPTDVDLYILMCPRCNQPNYFDYKGIQFPPAIYGKTVNNLPNNEMRGLYEEARKCFSWGAYTASIMCCQKLLMNIAVHQGASGTMNFSQYVNYLIEHHFVPPTSKRWVEYIREKGDEENHEIALMSMEDAKNLLDFIKILFSEIYKNPAMTEQHEKK
jgi:hypothetical protein